MARYRHRLYEELKQSKPFASLEEETFLQILRTADVSIRWVEEELERFGISPPQYNVLRILRGAGTRGLPSGEVGARMITREPDVTRLLGRLERKGLISRTRDAVDRRVVVARIAPEGVKLVEAATPAVLGRIARGLSGLGQDNLGTLSLLLEAIRHGWHLN